LLLLEAVQSNACKPLSVGRDRYHARVTFHPESHSCTKRERKYLVMRACSVRREPFMAAIASRMPGFTQRTDESTGQKALLVQTLLVIEDDPVIAQLLVSCLNLSAYSCSVINVRDMTISTKRENSLCPPPDGIILDANIYTMKMNPFDVVQALHKWWQTTSHMPPLILLTTNPVESAKLQQEGYTVVMKPFRPRVLLRTVRTSIEGKHEGETLKEEVIWPEL
jgi:CheY-like chemotaxis protein